MRASTGGPLGAFLMITPLVAIPVFAVVGIPQVAPLVGSAIGDDEPALSPQSAATTAAQSAPSKAKADDLFAPVAAAQRADKPNGQQPESTAESPAKARPDFRDLASTPHGIEWIPPTEALDGWALAADKPDRNSGEKISLAKFTQGLIHAVHDAKRSRTDAAGAEAERVGRIAVSRNPPRRIAAADPAPGRRAGTGSITWDAATQRLDELKIRNFKLEALQGEGRYLFTCVFAPVDDPQRSRRFEAVADEPLVAVREVLRQIDEWQLQH